MQSVLVAVATVSCAYAIGRKVVFPIPFTLVMTSPIWTALIVGSIAMAWGKAALQRCQELRQPIINSFIVWSCQFGRIANYPAYYFGYNALTPAGRTALTLCLPVIKLLLRVWFNSSVVHVRDELPEVVVTNVEVFNALIMMYCIQLTPSLLTTLGLMLLNFAQSVMSLHDISVIASEASDLQAKLRAIAGAAVSAPLCSHVDRAAAVIEPASNLSPAPPPVNLKRSTSTRKFTSRLV